MLRHRFKFQSKFNHLICECLKVNENQKFFTVIFMFAIKLENLFQKLSSFASPGVVGGAHFD